MPRDAMHKRGICRGAVAGCHESTVKRCCIMVIFRPDYLRTVFVLSRLYLFVYCVETAKDTATTVLM